MDEKYEKVKRIFPDYFKLFTIPEGAKEEKIVVYRACKTGKCDNISFTPSFEEKGCVFLKGEDPKNPSLYSLSTYEKPKDVKRFAHMNSDFQVPYVIAKGVTEPQYGLVQRTKERDPLYKRSSHVDWWLYKDATPYEAFQIIEDFDEYLKKYNSNGDKGNE